ncbi:family 10 glycosylhydrolase [Paenibacillus sp. HWE-109]|uniref:family 10 glycosylhydrolase n=1 Tax=Paenibacillus sp. HWE-109 TaxID=1306526 RepID=UPI001EDCCA96|nr:beta-galactosidase trimerization domain-containing protein [Paenibacillus sp. HWE-109]UKS29300.1 family 10 glycosylhydrolase [Paenibacillus sp. HWE-109]
MRFRQVHLDFHTSEAIELIGAQFEKKQFQEMLKLGHVDSITVFSKCHHGWAYHPSAVNDMHPGLTFDLLQAMIEAAHDINVKTPVYLSAGLDEKLARKHPEWLFRDQTDGTSWVNGFMKPGYHLFCMNSPYLEILLSQIKEVVTNYDVDGIFLDIVGVKNCYCHNCINSLLEQGKDPRDPNAVLELGELTYANYTARVNETIHAIKPGTPIFHNGGHIRRGRRDLAAMNTHLELESLPTGGWGYDHFPLSARYVQNLGLPYLGMTGKFHTSWGEFGGYKHPNALRYETALSLANGARCSVGDQLHPSGVMDEATYTLIGAAYQEVQTKEAWCVQADNVADIALISLEAAGAHYAADSTKLQSDAGAVRMLLESKYLFDVIDLDQHFDPYKVIILPDRIVIHEALKKKLQAFLLNGGKLLATGKSGLNEAGDAFAIDLGVKWVCENPYKPDYFRPHFALANLRNAAFVFYSLGQKIELDGGVELGQRENPYFNRDVFTFCSHQHTPSRHHHAGPGMVESASGIYFAWDVFDDYAKMGSLALKESVQYALDRLLMEHKTLQTNLPAQGIATLTKQISEKRYVQHLLYASPVKRGKDIEVIEDIVPLYQINVAIRIPEAATDVYLAPQMEPLAFETREQLLTFTVPKLDLHQMVVIEY